MTKLKPKERTSKKVATEAAWIMNDAGATIGDLKFAIEIMLDAIKLLEAAQSVAASAITQREK